MIAALLQTQRSLNALPDRIRVPCEHSNIGMEKNYAPHTHCKRSMCEPAVKLNLHFIILVVPLRIMGCVIFSTVSKMQI